MFLTNAKLGANGKPSFQIRLSTRAARGSSKCSWFREKPETLKTVNVAGFVRNRKPSKPNPLHPVFHKTSYNILAGLRIPESILKMLGQSMTCRCKSLGLLAILLQLLVICGCRQGDRVAVGPANEKNDKSGKPANTLEKSVFNLTDVTSQWNVDFTYKIITKRNINCF